MRIRVAHFTSGPHEIFQVLPRYSARQIFHDHPPTSLCRMRVRIVLTAPGRAIISSMRARGATAVALDQVARARCSISISSFRRTFRQFDNDPFPAKFLSIHSVGSILGVPRIFEFHKSETVLDNNISQATKFVKEIFQIAFFRSIWQTADVNPRSHS